MDCYGKRVATGSKDTTVALASLRPTGLAFDRVLGDAGGSEAFHKKVIKGVSLRDEIMVRERYETCLKLSGVVFYTCVFVSRARAYVCLYVFVNTIGCVNNPASRVQNLFGLFPTNDCFFSSF